MSLPHNRPKQKQHNIGAGVGPSAVPFHDTTKATSGCACNAGEALAMSGVQCQATCAGNVQQHEIVSSFVGSGVIEVQCPQGLFVLGCGFELASGTDNMEKYPQVFPSSTTSCKCYGNFGITCYASCGRFQAHQANYLADQNMVSIA